MRFLLTLQVKRGSILPLNYQYPLAAWIYKCIHRADSDFAQMLHSQGFSANGKPFKFFTFSRLNVPQREIYQDRLIIKSAEVQVTLSFLVEQAAEKFVTGVFLHQHVGLGDTQSQVDFEVTRIEARPAPTGTRLQLHTLSPIVVSQPVHNGSTLRAVFLSPQDPGYAEYFLKNLISKYQAYAEVTGNSISPTGHNELRWQLLPGPVRSRLVTIKAGTPQQTQVRGFDFSFEISGPEPLLRIGLLAGFGEKNSLGFGMVRE